VEVTWSLGGIGLTVEENLRLMKTLDDPWNKQDWETFMKRHAENVAVYWPGQPEPTRGLHAHHLSRLASSKLLRTILRMIRI